MSREQRVRGRDGLWAGAGTLGAGLAGWGGAGPGDLKCTRSCCCQEDPHPPTAVFRNLTFTVLF